MNIPKMLKVALVIILASHLIWFAGENIISTIRNVVNDNQTESSAEYAGADNDEVIDSGDIAETPENITTEYRRYVSVVNGSNSRGEDMFYTSGDTANDGSYRSFIIETYPENSFYDNNNHSTTEPIVDSVGHTRHLVYDLAVPQCDLKDKTVEAWLVVKAGDSPDPDLMQPLWTSEHMNCYSKPIEGSVDIPANAEYVYIESHLNNTAEYLPLLTNEIAVLVDD